MGGEREREKEREKEGVGEAGTARSVLGVHPNPSHGTKILGKMPLTKKAHKKSLTSIEQSLMAGPNCQAGQGKDGAVQTLGEEWLLVKEVSACVVVSGRDGAVLEHGNFS
jgi:hypothetical protein